MSATLELERTPESKARRQDGDSIARLYQVSAEREARARQRQLALWRHERPDVAPIIYPGTLTPDQKASFPSPDYLEAIRDPALMLSQQLMAAQALANGNSDGIPSIRANFGTGITLACLGLEQQYFTDKMPWLQQHMTKEQASRLTLDDIQIRGSFATALETIRRFREWMGDRVGIYCLDTQGPFDLAHLLLGDEIFTEIYDDPDFVHHVLEICLELGTRTHRWAKEAAGEVETAHVHSNWLAADTMGIRICEDTSAVVGPDVQQEFALPYTRRLAQTFGGAWVHYCGRNDHLTRGILEIPEVRGINFGHIPGHEQDHDFHADMEAIARAGKIYVGNWPLLPGEKSDAYLKRLHRHARQGVLLPFVNADLTKDGRYPTQPAALSAWYDMG